MSIDQRLEALTQSLELLAAMHMEAEKPIDATDKQIKRLGKHVHPFRCSFLTMTSD